MSKILVLTFFVNVLDDTYSLFFNHVLIQNRLPMMTDRYSHLVLYFQTSSVLYLGNENET